MVARLRTLVRSPWKLAFRGAFAAFGAWLGSFIGSGSWIDAGIAMGLSIVIVLVLIFVAVLVGWKSYDRLAAMRPMILVGALFLSGIAIGWAVARASAPPPPVVLEGQGTTSLSLAELDGFSSQGEAPAACRSESNSMRVEEIRAATAGTIGPEAVHVYLFMPAHLGQRPEVQVRIGPLDEGQQSEVAWLGYAEVVEGAAGGPRGQVAFTDLILYADYPEPTGLPTYLAGTLGWSCGEWAR